MQEQLAKLNEDQREAVVNFVGPCYVLAGPGSGKTLTIVHRVAYMIESGVPPNSIILFTFTKKAANELSERIVALIGNRARDILVGTYHSVCARFLRQYAHYLGYENNFTIYDQDESKSLMKKITEDDEFFDPAILLGYVDNNKRNLISYEEALKIAATDTERDMANFYKNYQIELKNNNAMDFGDLIYNMVRILQNNRDLRNSITNQYTYIISDETQDSNSMDFELIKLLGGERQNVCLIADDDQSIFGFRGADFNKTMELLNSSSFKEYQLKQNYRSTSTIVDASRSLISHNTNKKDKIIRTDNPEGPKIICYRERNAQAEANRALRISKALHKNNGIPYSEIAVLYRTNVTSIVLEEAFLNNDVPYTIVGGTSFFNRMEIKDILSYLKFIANPYDLVSFERIINTPKRKLGKKSVEKILSIESLENYGTISTDRVDLLTLCKEAQLTGASKSNLNKLIAILDVIQNNINSSTYDNIGNMINDIVTYIEYKEYLYTFDKPDERMANVSELIDIASNYNNLNDFLSSAMVDGAQISDEETQQERDAVNFLTMHSSKGLEYKAVIIVGANEGTCPHFRSQTIKEIEEERRLFYVAVTRAKEYLFITSKKYDNRRGMVYSEESRFVDEIDCSYIVKVNQEPIRSII